jgi:RNA polymerase sigma factor (sigma-70 family)
MASVAPELPVLARDQAFETLYRRYVKDVYHYALALLRNPADAEDVTQTTFMNAYRAYQRGDAVEKPQNWLIKIAHNVARTRYARASRRVKEVPLEEHVDQLALPEDEKPNIEGILRALGRLPFNQRAALVMRELEGRSYAEIADTLGVSVAAVETLIFRARRSLKVRATALRALSAVPLPGSLAGVLEGGGLAAGGLLTGGLVVKATVALVVGALATGVGGDRADRATAAPQTSVASAAPPNTAAGSAQRVGAKAAPVERGSLASVQLSRRHASTAARPAKKTPATSSLPTTHLQPTGSSSVSASSAGGSPSQTSSPVETATQVAAPVTDAVSAVEQTVAETVATLPVQPPALPPPPVELPPAPKLP